LEHRYDTSVAYSAEPRPYYKDYIDPIPTIDLFRSLIARELLLPAGVTPREDTHAPWISGTWEGVIVNSTWEDQYRNTRDTSHTFRALQQ